MRHVALATTLFVLLTPTLRANVVPFRSISNSRSSPISNDYMTLLASKINSNQIYDKIANPNRGHNKALHNTNSAREYYSAKMHEYLLKSTKINSFSS